MQIICRLNDADGMMMSGSGMRAADNVQSACSAARASVPKLACLSGRTLCCAMVARERRKFKKLNFRSFLTVQCFVTHFLGHQLNVGHHEHRPKQQHALLLEHSPLCLSGHSQTAYFTCTTYLHIKLMVNVLDNDLSIF